MHLGWGNSFSSSRALTTLLLCTSALVVVLPATASLAQDAANIGTAEVSAPRGRMASMMTFEIASGKLSDALTVWAKTSGLKILAPTDKIKNVQTAGATGRLTAADALHQLLSGTELDYRMTNERHVTIFDPKALLDAHAQAAGALPTIDVEGTSDGTNGYVATRSTSATKTDTPLIQTPASISVVTQQQIVDQNAQSISQALRYTPGVVAEQRGVNEESLEYLYSRGFQAETYLDGLRVPFTGFNIASRDTYLIDHIESIRGPASILYGQSPPGGLINIVSKMPTDVPFHEVFVQSGSYGRAQGGFDLSGPLNDDKSLLYRVTGVGFTTGTQTQFVDQQRVAIAPSFTWRPDADTKLTVMANYQNDPEAGTFNYVPAVGTVLPGAIHIPRSFNTGDPGFDTYKKQEASIAYFFEHRFDEVWEVKQNFRFLHNEQQIQHVGDGSDYTAPGSTTLNRLAYNNFGTVNAATIDNQAIATFDTGVLKHKALFGIDYQHTQYNHYLLYGSNSGPDAPPLNIANPVYYQRIPTPDFMLGTSNKQLTEQLGLYAQDQITIGKLTVVGGIRQDWTSTETIGYKDGVRTQQDDHALTGRGGLIYNFDNGIAPYFSYSTSFQPQGGTATDTGQALKPSEGEQYETGLKYQPVGSKSFYTASVFDLRQTNVKVQNGQIVTQIGEVHSQGVELEAHAFITDRWQAIASYTYNDLKNTSAAPSTLGKVPAGIPANMASLWMSYDMPDDVAPGLKVSGGTRFFGPSYGDPINSFKVPSYTLFDIGLQYDIGRQVAALKGFSANINVSNLFDKTYVTCTDLTYCTYGQGRLVLAGLKYRW